MKALRGEKNLTGRAVRREQTYEPTPAPAACAFLGREIICSCRPRSRSAVVGIVIVILIPRIVILGIVVVIAGTG
jgi:hypothetical protein